MFWLGLSRAKPRFPFRKPDSTTHTTTFITNHPRKPLEKFIVLSSADRTQRAPGLSAAALANAVVVGRGPMANMLSTSRGCPRGWIAVVSEVIGGAGPTPWRVWRTPARWVSPAGADMGGGAAVVVSGPDAGAGHPGGWLGPSQGWISSSPRSGCGVGSVARGGRHPGPPP